MIIYFPIPPQNGGKSTYQAAESMVGNLPIKLLRVWWEIYLSSCWTYGGKSTYQAAESIVGNLLINLLKGWWEIYHQAAESMVGNLPIKLLWWEIYLSSCWKDGGKSTYQAAERMVGKGVYQVPLPTAYFKCAYLFSLRTNQVPKALGHFSHFRKKSENLKFTILDIVTFITFDNF